MNRILIIDGSNLLFQMFFGMPSRIVNSKGKAIHGTLGFTGALLKIVRWTIPTHMAVLFDGQHKNTRLAINPDYKATRTDYSKIPTENSPFSQINDIYKVLDFMDIKHMETIACETDDIIAGYATSFGKQCEITISSLDSDFFQLITDNVSVLRYRGKRTTICTPGYINENLKITPGQYADFKSLTGDRSDNIKGADKIGPKTAAALLNEFGTLENLLANPQNIKKPSIRESIIRNTERLKNNYKIIKLYNTMPLPFSLNELEYIYNGITTSEVLSGIDLI